MLNNIVVGSLFQYSILLVRQAFFISYIMKALIKFITRFFFWSKHETSFSPGNYDNYGSMAPGSQNLLDLFE